MEAKERSKVTRLATVKGVKIWPDGSLQVLLTLSSADGLAPQSTLEACSHREWGDSPLDKILEAAGLPKNKKRILARYLEAIGKAKAVTLDPESFKPCDKCDRQRDQQGAWVEATP